ncbi:MAG: PKD domain-containing protein [Acidobacteriota bacterium]
MFRKLVCSVCSGFIVSLAVIALVNGSALGQSLPRPIVQVLTPEGTQDTSLSSGYWMMASGKLGTLDNPIPVPDHIAISLKIGDRVNPQWPPGDSQLNGISIQTVPASENEVSVFLVGGASAKPSLTVRSYATWALNVPKKLVVEVSIGPFPPPDPNSVVKVAVWFKRTTSSSGGGGGNGGGGGGTANSAPVVNAGADQTANFGQQSVVLAGTATDANGDNLTYTWTQVFTQSSGTGAEPEVNILNPSQKNASFEAPSTSHTLTFKLCASDGKATTCDNTQVFVGGSGGGSGGGGNGGGSGDPGQLETVCSDESSINNDPAVANAGPDREVQPGDPVVVNGGGSDPDNTPPQTTIIAGVIVTIEGLSFQWEVINGAGLPISLQNATTSSVSFTAPEVDEDTTIVLALTVKDTKGCGTRDHVSITIKSAVTLTADAGSDQTAGKGQKVTLSGSGSDSEGGTLSYLWSQISGKLVGLAFANRASASFNAPSSITEDIELVFQLTVTNGSGKSATDNVTIMISANSAPELTALEDKAVTSGASVELAASATDAEGDELTFSWTQVSGPDVTLENADKAAASFTAPTVEEEEQIVFKVTVSDGTSEVEDTVTVNVRPGTLNALVFPASVDTGNPFFENTSVGVAVLNSNSSANNISISNLKPNGESSPGGNGPIELSGKGQSAWVTSQFVEDPEIAALLVQGDAGPIQGFFMVFDNNLNRMDGIGGKLVESEEFYFPLARQGEDETTLFFIFNPGDVPAEDVKLQWLAADGTLLKEVTDQLEAGGMIKGSLDQIFGSLEGAQAGPQTFQSETPSSDGYVKITGDVPLKGFQFLGTASDYTSLTAQVGMLVRKLLVPHFFIDGRGGDTEIRLLNTGENAASVKLQAFNDNADSVGTDEFEVEPGKLFVGSLKERLGLQVGESEVIQGHVRLEISGGTAGAFTEPAMLIGAVSFSGNSGNFKSMLPMIEEGRLESLFLHVAQSEEVDVFTGFALLNMEAVPANVKIEVFNTDGELTAENTFLVGAKNRLVGLLNELLDDPAFSQVGGHIRVTSDQPVVTFALFGDFQSKFLSAIEGQTPEE